MTYRSLVVQIARRDYKPVPFVVPASAGLPVMPIQIKPDPGEHAEPQNQTLVPGAHGAIIEVCQQTWTPEERLPLLAGRRGSEQRNDHHANDNDHLGNECRV